MERPNRRLTCRSVFSDTCRRSLILNLHLLLTPMDYGPQQFELTVRDSFAANNPADESDDAAVEVVTPVTICWNLHRTALEKDQGVVFSAPRWLGSGKGPIQVFEEKLGGNMAKTGSASWEQTTEVLQKVEMHGNGKKYRLLVTPQVRLLRTFVPATGGSPRTEEVAKAAATARGTWVDLPETA